MEFTVRNVVESDLEKIMNWRMSPEVTTYMNTNPKLTMEKQRKWFEALKNQDIAKYFWII